MGLSESVFEGMKQSLEKRFKGKTGENGQNRHKINRG